jgi:hypothetical protein
MYRSVASRRIAEHRKQAPKPWQENVCVLSYALLSNTYLTCMLRNYTSARSNLLYSTSTLLYSTLLYSTLLYSTPWTILYSTPWTILYSTPWTILYSTLLYSTLLYDTLLYSILLPLIQRGCVSQPLTVLLLLLRISAFDSL